jgi:hypothetical protein
VSPHHRRRNSDPPSGNGRRPWKNGWRWWLWYGERVWQDLIPLVALVLAAIAVFGTQSDVERQREGRGIAINVLCGVSNGIVDAGREILTDTLPGTEHYQRPHSALEKSRAQAYADSYARVISFSVAQQAGVQAEGVLRHDGTIDCDALSRAAQTRPR